MDEAKFRIDDIVLESSLEVAKQFECAVCLHVAQELVVQTPCGHVYCKECLAPCSLCPQCREPFEASAVRLLRDVNKMGMRMMQAIRVQCPHGKFKAASADSGLACDAHEHEAGPRAAKRPRLEAGAEEKLDVCKWQGSYGDLLSKHFCECPLHPVPCPQGCGRVLPRGELTSHRLSCERSFEDCWICGDRVPIGGMAAHNQEKSVQHVDVLAAKLQACEAAASEQRSLSIRLALVEEQLKARASTAHVTRVVKASAEEVKAHMNSQLEEVKVHIKSPLVKHAEWQVKDIAKLKLGLAPGKCVTSPKFALGGISGFTIQFYPNGDNPGTGLPCVFVQNDPGNIKAVIEISACGKTEKKGDLAKWETNRYRWDLGSLANHNDMLTIEATLLSGSYKVKL